MFGKKNKKEEKKSAVTAVKTVNTSADAPEILPYHEDNVPFTTQTERSEYTSRIGDDFVSKRMLDLTESELENLSISDGAEMIRLETWLVNKVVLQSPELEKTVRERMLKLAAVIAKKIIKTDEIYVVFSKTTGCPQLFSQTYKNEEGYVTTPPAIRIFTKSETGLITENTFADNGMELRKIENGEKKEGIQDFLGSCFYIDGACVVEINSEGCRIGSDLLVAPPDLSNVPENKRPVMNPDVMRWSLLISQLPLQQTPDSMIIFSCYYNHLLHALLSAKFLAPIKPGEGFPDAKAEEGTVKIEKNAKFGLMTGEGRKGRQAIYLYTDWKHFHESVNKEENWSGLVTGIEGFISTFDCIINFNKDYKARGFYFSQDDYNRLKDLANK